MKAVVLLSGGLDSATCLSVAIEKFGNKNVAALSIFYRQKNVREMQSAKAIADFYGVELYQLDISQIFSKCDCPLIEGSGREIEHKSYAEQLTESGVPTYVPFRNGLMLSAAASFAYSLFGAAEIYIGAHADDAAGNAYADCSEKFIDAMNMAVSVGTYGKIKIVAPFVRKTKADVVTVGLELNTPYELTWSCYEGGEKPCGRCGTCIARAAAFRLNGVKDPAEVSNVHGNKKD